MKKYLFCLDTDDVQVLVQAETRNQAIGKIVTYLLDNEFYDEYAILDIGNLTCVDDIETI